MKFLFISHAEKDSNIVRKFVDLLYDIGLREENIFCSSISEIGVPIKEDIYDYLRNLLDSEEVIPVFMLSENYYDSAACLNEMGAVWLKQKDYYTFLLPNFTFKEIRGAINPNKRAIKLEKAGCKLKDDLTLFKNSLCELFSLPPISEQRWERYRNEFIEFLNNVDTEKEIVFDIDESETYCIGDVNHDACKLTVDKNRNELMFEFDFEKTTSQLCSAVLFTGGINLKKHFKSSKKLEFYIKASESVKEVNVEMHLLSKNPYKCIKVDNEWQRYVISLNDFSKLENLWEVCNEICFVVDRAKVIRGRIEIKDIRIY